MIKLEPIISRINDSFSIRLSDIEITDNGYILGNLLLYINDVALGEIDSIDLINATPTLELLLVLKQNEVYVPIIEDQLFKKSKLAIINNLVLPICRSDNSKIEYKNIELDNYSSIIPSSGPFNNVVGVMIRSSDNKDLRVVWTNYYKDNCVFHDEIISYKLFNSTIIRFLDALDEVIEKFTLVNSNKEELVSLKQRFSSFLD